MPTERSAWLSILASLVCGNLATWLGVDGVNASLSDTVVLALDFLVSAAGVWSAPSWPVVVLAGVLVKTLEVESFNGFDELVLLEVVLPS